MEKISKVELFFSLGYKIGRRIRKALGSWFWKFGLFILFFTYFWEFFSRSFPFFCLFWHMEGTASVSRVLLSSCLLDLQQTELLHVSKNRQLFLRKSWNVTRLSFTNWRLSNERQSWPVIPDPSDLTTLNGVTMQHHIYRGLSCLSVGEGFSLECDGQSLKSARL